MQIAIELSQILTAAGSIIVVLSCFLLWVVKTVSSEAKKRADDSNSIHDIKKTLQDLGENLQSGEERFQRIEEQVSVLGHNIMLIENKTVQRIEILETLKRTEQFFEKMVMELTLIAGHKIDVPIPDLTGHITARQQVMDDRRRNSL